MAQSSVRLPFKLPNSEVIWLFVLKGAEAHRAGQDQLILVQREAPLGLHDANTFPFRGELLPEADRD